jgi:hypothetical protein
VGNIELDTISHDVKNVQIEPLLARMQLVIPLAPIKQPLQSFSRPLQSFHMPLKYPLKTVPMPMKPVRMPENVHGWFINFEMLMLKENIKRKVQNKI